MGKRGKQPWSREKLPLGTVRIRRRSRRGQTVRMVKVRDHGPISGRWIALARYWWLKNRGPIRAGMRVVHWDGNLLNDAPDNYRLVTADDVLMLSRQWDPELDARNHRRAAQGVAKSNRDRSRVERARRYLPDQWYAVDPRRAIIINEPYRSRLGLAKKYVDCETIAPNGEGIQAVWLGWPAVSGVEAELLAALADGRHVALATIRERMAETRRLHGWGAQCQQSTCYTGMWRLRQRGWIEPVGAPRGRGLYAIAPAALESRREPCRLVAVRGRDIETRFPGFRKVWPEKLTDAA